MCIVGNVISQTSNRDMDGAWPILRGGWNWFVAFVENDRHLLILSRRFPELTHCDISYFNFGERSLEKSIDRHLLRLIWRWRKPTTINRAIFSTHCVWHCTNRIAIALHLCYTERTVEKDLCQDSLAGAGLDMRRWNQTRAAGSVYSMVDHWCLAWLLVRSFNIVGPLFFMPTTQNTSCPVSLFSSFDLFFVNWWFYILSV